MILITGANGQLGTELRHLLDERNEEYVAVDVAEMDLLYSQASKSIPSDLSILRIYIKEDSRFCH